MEPWLCTSILEGAVWVARVSPNLPCASRWEDIEILSRLKDACWERPAHVNTSRFCVLSLTRPRTAIMRATVRAAFASCYNCLRGSCLPYSTGSSRFHTARITFPSFLGTITWESCSHIGDQGQIPSSQRSLLQLCQYATQQGERSFMKALVSCRKALSNTLCSFRSGLTASVIALDSPIEPSVRSLRSTSLCIINTSCKPSLFANTGRLSKRKPHSQSQHSSHHRHQRRVAREGSCHGKHHEKPASLSEGRRQFRKTHHHRCDRSPSCSIDVSS